MKNIKQEQWRRRITFFFSTVVVVWVIWLRFYTGALPDTTQPGGLGAIKWLVGNLALQHFSLCCIYSPLWDCLLAASLDFVKIPQRSWVLVPASPKFYCWGRPWLFLFVLNLWWYLSHWDKTRQDLIMFFLVTVTHAAQHTCSLIDSISFPCTTKESEQKREKGEKERESKHQ